MLVITKKEVFISTSTRQSELSVSDPRDRDRSPPFNRSSDLLRGISFEIDPQEALRMIKNRLD